MSDREEVATEEVGAAAAAATAPAADLGSDEEEGAAGAAAKSEPSSAAAAAEDDDKKDDDDDKAEAQFECNICLDVARDAVISLCGHLFCWPCLHQWLETRPNRKICPVCKAGISKEKVIPLYGRGNTDQVSFHRLACYAAVAKNPLHYHTSSPIFFLFRRIPARRRYLPDRGDSDQSRRTRVAPTTSSTLAAGGTTAFRDTTAR